jgi:hypothetical protein
MPAKKKAAAKKTTSKKTAAKKKAANKKSLQRCSLRGYPVRIALFFVYIPSFCQDTNKK